MKFLDVALLIVNIVSFIGTLLFVPFGIIEYLLGPDEAMKMLKRFNISCSYRLILTLGFICIGTFLASILIRKIYFR